VASRVARLALFTILVSVLVTTVLLTAGMGDEDLVVYWSAARLLAQRQNPYDAAALRGLQQQVRPQRAAGEEQGFASWNPPWLLLVLLPLGMLPLDLAVPVWAVTNIALIAVASLLAWRLAGGKGDRTGTLMTLASGWLFGATLWTIHIGQVSGLLLLGLVLGSWWLSRGQDSRAGAAFFLGTFKPHILYLVLLVLLLWVIRSRRWRVLGGIGAAGLVSVLALCWIFPGWGSAYWALVSGHSFAQYSTSTIGGLAYALWGTQAFRYAGVLLLPFVPRLVRLVEAHGWFTAMNVALLASLPLAMYGYSFDQVVLLPAVVQMLAWMWLRHLSGRWAWVVGAGLLLVYGAYVAQLTMPAQYYHYFAWPPIALAGLYALAWVKRNPLQAGA
jgi:hypothetical protein